MNYEKSKTSDPHWLLFNLLDKTNLKRSDKNIALWDFSVYNTWRNIEKSWISNKFRISSSTWNQKFELPDGWYSTSDIQDSFEYI